MKSETPRSLKAHLSNCLTRTVIVCFLVTLFYFVYSIVQSYDYLAEKNMESLITASDRLDDTLNAMRGFSESLTVNNIQFRTLSQKNCTEQQRIVAEHTLKDLIEIQTPNCGISLIYDASTDKAIFYYGTEIQNALEFLKNVSFMHYLGGLISDTHNYNYNQWFLFQGGERNLLLLVNRARDLYFCTMLDINRYFELNPISTYSDRWQMLGFYKTTSVICPPELTPVLTDDGALSLRGHFVSRTALASCPVQLALAAPYFSLVSSQLASVLIFLLAATFLILFLKRVIHDLDQSLLFPLQEIAMQMALLTGEAPPQIKPIPGNYQEYAAIHAALSELVHQKNELEAQNYANREQKEHALLQYYQLQTRSHFFLNCLKSLYSMAENSNWVQMQSMIIAFSNHLRYIFHDNLDCVPLRDEINEVMDYHRIINLDSSVPFLLTQSVPRELLDIPVPPLIIQTFLENTYKYAGRSRRMLVFHIEASEATYHDSPYLRLHLSDNGCGYGEEVLENINSNHPDVFSDYHVGINNLCHRMALLYGDRCKTAFYNEEQGGAHSVLYIPITRETGES